MRHRILFPLFFGILIASVPSCKIGEARCPTQSKLVGGMPPNGSEEWCEYRDADGKTVKHGSYVAWYKNAQKQAEVNYVHGKENGPTTLWYPSGKKMLEGSYHDGERDGLWARWYESGTKELETEFSTGKKNGQDRRWDEKGTLVIDLEWKNGEIVRSNLGAPPPDASGALQRDRGSGNPSDNSGTDRNDDSQSDERREQEGKRAPYDVG